MKKFLSLATMALILLVGLVACGNNDNNDKVEGSVRVGMVTNSGSIDDKSFNEGTWKGIERFKNGREGIVAQHLQPGSMMTTELITNAEDLIMAGVEILLLPSFVFEEASTVLQERHPNVKFVTIDGEPEVMAPNTVAIYFAEEQAGFLAGISAALETQTNKVGFIGGIQIPPVQRFGWGFLAGVAYANEAFGLDVEVAAFQFEGTFDNVQAGQTLAGGMYDMGIDIIFAAAGAVGNGVITEAKLRTRAGESVFVIGVDIDQFEEGLMADGHSVILTSAIKRVDVAAYDILDMFVNDEFPGGEIIVMDVQEDGVGLPETNPNLSAETEEKITEVLAKLKDGVVVVPQTAEELTSWFETLDFNIGNITY